jgi:hypothetical protein
MQSKSHATDKYTDRSIARLKGRQHQREEEK